MTALDRLATSDTPVVMELMATYDAPVPMLVGTLWDNQPTWDNWAKTPAPFDNRPTWDNWNKKEPPGAVGNPPDADSTRRPSHRAPGARGTALKGC
ncbi:multiple cyclophane-containing RiPP AmcA [Streptomyces typhae]|uniref:multiple cyclophane-containing RiPP AmcA n=1 Tax=Streptomyces typhae TaxID=2681492 RepID=UPI0012F689BE|nr:multiple cyclophane-containing RiPP AmcA [Streptomyces typhae]